MADRAFGVREINIVGSAGTPTISSPDNINLNGNNVAISTDLQVGRNVKVIGIVTAVTYYGDGSNLTGIAATGGGGGSIAGIDTAGTSTFNDLNVSGMTTLGTNVNIGDGASYLQIYNQGQTIFRPNGQITIQAGGGSGPYMRLNNNTFIQLVPTTGYGVYLYYGTAQKLVTTNTGITVTGTVAAGAFTGDGSGLTNLPGGGGSIAGISTTGTSFFNTIHATGTIDIGTTNAGVAVTHMTIDSADVSGTIRNRIQSGAGNTDAVLDIQTKEFLVTDPYAGKGALIAADSSGTKLFKDDSLKLQTIGTGVTVTGTMYATSFSGDGSGLTGVPITGNTGSFVRVDTQEIVVSGLSTFQGNVYLGDNDVLNIGDTNDLQIWHSGSASIIRDAGTGELQVQSNGTAIRFSDTSGNKSALFNTNADANLYYADALRLQTLGAGVTVFGTLDTQGLNISGVTTTTGAIHIDSDSADRTGAALKIGNSVNGDLSIYHTGTETVYWDNYGRTRFAGGKWEWTNLADNQQVVEFDQTYGVKLNYAGTRRFMTTNDGVHVAGIMTATSVSIGGTIAQPNLTISSDGTDSFIRELHSTGELTISTNQLKIENSSFETLARFNENADVKLYYDNAEKFATTNTGAVVTGILTATSFSGSLSGQATAANTVTTTFDATDANQYISFTGGGGNQSNRVSSNLRYNPSQQLLGINTSNPTATLDVNGTVNVTGVSTFQGDVRINTDDKLRLGDSGSENLQIYTNGTNSFFKQLSGDLKYELANQFIVQKDTGDEPIAIFTADGSVELYYDNSKKFETTADGIVVTGILTATSFSGDGSALTGIESYPTWTLGANGSTDYTFTGIGFTVTTNDPVLYLARGQKYAFDNQSGGTHPFEIRVSDSGTAYNHGVTNNGASTGTIVFEVPFNAPSTLFYQCTAHSGMGNTIRIYPDLI